MTSLFLYGRLQAQDLLEIVLGHAVDPARWQPGWVADHAACRVAGADYPALLPRPGQRTEGVLLDDATGQDLQRLAAYEGADFHLAPITVETASGFREAQYFQGTEELQAGAEPWDFAAWRRDHLPVALEMAREFMHHAQTRPIEEIDRIWSGVLIRAHQRARALAAEPRLGAIRTAFGPEDVETRAIDRAYTSFLAVQELHLRHRRFDGDWTGELNRSVVAWGDAVTVLPYDPRRDRVLLIEQFRPAPAARGDRNPWCIEVVAGRIDRAESAEATARREAREEAGLEIGRMVETGGYYPTPGLACEHLTGFVGEADLPGEGGLHGLADEHEDIRTIVLGFEAAMEAVAAGAVNTGPALIALLWLAANRDRLRQAWAVRPAGKGVEAAGSSD